MRVAVGGWVGVVVGVGVRVAVGGGVSGSCWWRVEG